MSRSRVVGVALLSMSLLLQGGCIDLPLDNPEPRYSRPRPPSGPKETYSYTLPPHPPVPPPPPPYIAPPPPHRPHPKPTP